jgi:hypothetical protein
LNQSNPIATISLEIFRALADHSPRHGIEPKAHQISNAGLTITALPLLAARDWGTFKTNGLDVEIIVMSPPLGAAAMAQGDIDYVAGVGPASVAATLTGLASRAIWFSSDRISYWFRPRRSTEHRDLQGKNRLCGGVAAPTRGLVDCIEVGWRRLHDGRHPRPAIADSLFSGIRFRRSRADVAAAYFRRGEKGF